MWLLFVFKDVAEINSLWSSPVADWSEQNHQPMRNEYDESFTENMLMLKWTNHRGTSDSGGTGLAERKLLQVKERERGKKKKEKKKSRWNDRWELSCLSSSLIHFVFSLIYSLSLRSTDLSSKFRANNNNYKLNQVTAQTYQHGFHVD